jgi:hypothetical protein
MPSNIDIIKAQLYKTVNFISYKEKNEAKEFSRRKLEDDFADWLEQYIFLVSAGETTNMYNADGTLSDNRIISLNGKTLTIGNLVFDNAGKPNVSGQFTSDSYSASSVPIEDNNLTDLFAYDPLDGSFKTIDLNTIQVNNTNIYTTSGSITEARTVTIDPAGSLDFSSYMTMASNTATISANTLDINGVVDFYIRNTGSTYITSPLPTIVDRTKVLAVNPVGTVLSYLDLSSINEDNIYNADGQLEANRQIAGAGLYSLSLGYVGNEITGLYSTVTNGDSLTFEPELFELDIEGAILRFENNPSGVVNFIVGNSISNTGQDNFLIGENITAESNSVYAMTEFATIRVNSDGSAIIGGTSNEINSVTNAILLGMDTHIATVSNSTYVQNLRAYGDVYLDTYGSGTHIGTTAYFLAVDASGNVIETTASNILDGSGTTANAGGVDLGGRRIIKKTIDGNAGSYGIQFGVPSTGEIAGFDVYTAIGGIGLNSTANVAIQGIIYPGADGTPGQLLQTDGLGTLSFVDAPTSSPLTTKGDIYTYDTGEQRLPVGTDNSVLVADSAEATGLRWAEASEHVAATTLSTWVLDAGTIYYQDFAHNLNTEDIGIEIYDSVTKESVLVEKIDRTSLNNVRIYVEGNTASLRVVVWDAIFGIQNTSLVSVVSNPASPYDASNKDVVIIDATSGNKIVNLPPVASSTNYQITVKKTDATANTVTIEADGAETIDGGGNAVIETQYTSLTVACDGSAWFII